MDFMPWFNAATAFNELAMSVLSNLNIDLESRQQITTAALYDRVLTSYQATILLAERGMLSDSRTIVRGAVENAIVLAAIIKDAAVCDLLVDRHFWHHRKLRQAWLSDKDAVAQMTTQDEIDIKANIADIDARHPKVRELKSDPVVIATLSQKVELTALYNAVYRGASGDAAHTSIDALNRHVKFDDQGRMAGLNFGPDVMDLPRTLSDAMSVLGHALQVTIEFFRLSTFEDELVRCIANRKVLGIPSDYQPHAT
jgi:hypothetical protein